MKKICFFILNLLLVACVSAQSVRLEVKNALSKDRKDEIVSVDWLSITKKMNLKERETVVVLNPDGQQVPYQLIYNGKSEPESLIFLVEVSKNSKANYLIKKGKPEIFKRRTFGRQVPERKDDFAWENDRVAFRMYGPALTPENPSNGVDIWMKRTSDLVINDFYDGDLNRKISYHVDHGRGLDCYSVGHTPGAGGLAPFLKDSLWIAGAYRTAKVLDSGMLRTTFELSYDSILVNGKIFTEKLVVTLDAGSQFNRGVVSYDGDFDSFELTAGINLHKNKGVRDAHNDGKGAGYIAYAEDAVSDAGVPSGRTYVGVVFPKGWKKNVVHNSTMLAFANYKKGQSFTYYFGGGWSQWGFETDNDWFNYVKDFLARQNSPLVVTIK